MENINFGIDLGTTNSGIGKYENGRVQVLKNPVGLRDILPSAVSFYRGRILIGDKAREQSLSNAGNVFSAFKRKMGSNDTYHLNLDGEDVKLSPVDLSAYVLKELRNYLPGTDIHSAVITIPASFDTIQSNATKQAGYQAGFKEVVLLQEPIAACLAYANLSHLNLDKEQKWLVYDFGGGTFDAALVYINQRELKILDNKGNNFLGGVDIDQAFIKHIIAPKISEVLKDDAVWDNLIKRTGAYDKFWHYLSYLAEEAKKQLSVAKDAWIEIDFPELDLFFDFVVTRAEFNKVVKPLYEETEKFLITLLEENGLTFNNIERIVMVGGATYIPFIKDSLRAASQSIVDDSIDPTTAIITGAAYYAGAHATSVGQKVNTEDKSTEPGKPEKLDVKLSFETYSNDLEELIAFKTALPFSGNYRITRTDGGFDSGLLSFDQSASTFVTLIPKSKNTFRLTISDSNNVAVYDTTDIAISHGLYAVSGQLLPEDICIELDSKENGTYLEPIFKRNSILPLKKTLYKTFSKSIIKGSSNKVIINVLEGRSGTLPGANLSIGYIELLGTDIANDLIQGTDIEIQVEMDESRGLQVDIYIPSTEQQLTHNFHIAQREVNISKLLQDIAAAEADIQKEIDVSNAEEAYELSDMFQRIADKLSEIKRGLKAAETDIATEEKYRLDERKRKLLGELDNLTRAREVYIAVSHYKKEKEIFIAEEEHSDEIQKKRFEKILADENELLKSADKHQINKVTDDLKRLNHEVWAQKDESYIQLFLQLISLPAAAFKSGFDRSGIIESGKKAMEAKDYAQLRQVDIVLFNQLIDELKSPSARKKEHDETMRTMKIGLR